MVAQDIFLRFRFSFWLLLWFHLFTDDFKMVGADLSPAAIASVSGSFPQQAQNV